jgi:Apc13p protein.
MSDSNYVAATRHRKPASLAGRLPSLEIVDDEWAADHLSDDEVDCRQQEASVQPLLGDIDVDTVVVSTGHSDSAQNDSDRRRRQDARWNDLALDRFDSVIPLIPEGGVQENQNTGGNS